MEIPIGREIAAYLEGLTPAAHGETSWAGGTMPLRLTTYLSAFQAPIEYVSSVRCLLLKGTQVLVVRSSDNTHHLLPGGRREDGESLLETAKRELLEETGYTASAVRQLGIVHFHHLREAPAGYRYPHPDFLWLVFGGQAGERVTQPGDDAWEAEVFYRPVDALADLTLSEGDHVFLRAALRLP